MRHGTSVANEQGIINGDPEKGEEPTFGLTTRGRQEALKSAFLSQLPAETRIYASPFSRTRETAETVRHVIGASAVSIAGDLRERRFGQLEGKPVSSYEHVWFHDERNSAAEYMGVEPAKLVAVRGLRLICQLEREHTDQDILLVSHGDPLQILEATFKGMPAGDHRQLPELRPAEIRRL